MERMAAEIKKRERLKIFSGALFIIKYLGNQTGKVLPQQRAT
jgi:hypothetical protein